MWPLTKIEAKKQIKDKSLLFWTLLLPIVTITFMVELFSRDSAHKTLVASQLITGMSIVFSTFIIISIVISFVKDREKGMVARLASTPLKNYHFFLGKCIPFFIIIASQILLLTVIGVYLYDIQITHYASYLTVTLFISIWLTSWGVAIALYAKTENTGLVMSNMIALVAAVTCGLWTPFDQLPGYLQTIGIILPQYWAHQGLLQFVSTLPGGENLGIVVLILIGYSILGFALSLVGYRRYMKMARS
ncbi:ABC transporter permease [Bacillus chungangensis]|uniref:Transport permease protein n=1 Tax=Bacillus chungangensis TaxID=587633 RepID=A0ABT9WW80_9BACI|nr:ABC transporter permease [Bacillus chungangensis]MDQ0177137.1 ABC-2 type transport system permease protein [Bacillus chungangensis]